MEECYKCGISGNKVKLYSAISNKGIVKICGDCNSIEKFPIIKQPTEQQIADSKNLRHISISERLRNMNKGIIAGKEVNLRTLVDKKFETNTVQIPSDIIPNFHWTIQRIRRSRKISREAFARGIGELESTVRMIEQGILPEENYKIINKIENFLQVNLRKEGSSRFPDTSRKFILDNTLTEKMPVQKKSFFSRDSTKDMKVEDLKKLNKKDDSVEIWEEEYSQDDEQFLDKQENFDEDKE